MAVTCRQPERHLVACFAAWCALVAFSSANTDNFFVVSSEQSIVNAGSEGALVSLPFDLVLFDRKLVAGEKLWISEHGYVSVGSEYRLTGRQEKIEFPLSNPAVNPTLIMAYYAKMRYYPTTDSDTMAKVSYAWLDNVADLDIVSASIRQNSPAGRQFRASHGLIVTWEKTAPEDPRDFIPNFNRNTFQMAILTEAQNTYVIFNYGLITWASSENYTQAGFNLGGEEAAVRVPHSGPMDTIDDGQASGTRGRYIFFASSRAVHPVSCFPDGTHPLQISRSYGAVFGGDTVWVAGPCFPENQPVRCQFGDETVDARRESVSMVSCTPPMQYRLGRVPLSLWLGDSRALSQTAYTLVLFGRIEPGVELVNVNQWDNASLSQDLKIHWNRSAFPVATQTVHIKLFAYSEESDKAIMSEFQTIKSDVVNSGDFTFKPADINCRASCAATRELGAIAVRSAAADDTTTLWSYHIPMGWFVGSSPERSNWATEECRNFWKKDATSTAWSTELLPCPCSLEQAMADFGRFQADVGCNVATGSVCTYHVGAKHCVRSVHATPGGAGNQCCYDDKGELMYAGDSDYGSTPDRSHNWGAPPYIKAGRVPDASHWLVDVVPFYYCCLWTSGSCYIYMDLRPTKDCNEYSPPKSAAVFGDPHFLTFDGVSYTFNGKGDFVLMDAVAGSGRFKLHGRFAQPGRNVNATVLNRIAVQEKDSDIVEVEANKHGMVDIMTVYVNYEPVSFAARELHWQEFKGPTYVAYEEGESPSYTIILPSGVGVKVSSAGSSLAVFVMAPPHFKYNMLQGLLGTWDDNRYNEIADNSDIDVNTDIEHYGNQRKLGSEADSLFRYKPSLGLDYRNNVTGYRARTDEATSEDSRALDLCAGVKQCLFDIAISGDESLAMSSRKAIELFSNFSSMLTNVTSCGMPVEHGKRQGNSYLLGSKVKVTGCIPGYELAKGDTFDDDVTYQCTSGGTWMPPVAALCKFAGWPALPEALEEAESDVLVIVLAVCLPVLLIAAGVGAIAFCFVKRKNRKIPTEIRETPDKSSSLKGTDRSQNATTDGAFKYLKTNTNISAEKGRQPEQELGGRSYRMAIGGQVPA